MAARFLTTFVKYALVGGTSSLINLVAFYLLHLVGVHYLLAAAASYIGSTLFNYWMSIVFVFQSGARFQKHGELFWIFVVTIVGLLLNQALLFAMVSWLGWHPLVAQVVSLCAVFFWNFLARHHFVFRAKRPDETASS